MFRTLKETRRGFTLIELLVVIAIIGILSAVVLASLSTARAKARDSKRVSDVGQIQLALELYFDSNQSYPLTAPVGGSPGTAPDAAVSHLATLNFLPKLPVPPAGGSATYLYRGIFTNGGNECTGTSSTAGQTACLSYVVGIQLERADNSVLANDADLTLGTVFYGSSETCVASGGTGEKCYDLKP